jgi:hypothetical protein
MRRILTGLAMLAVPTLAFTAAVTLGTYLNSAGQPQSIQGVTLLNQDGTVATIGGGGGGGAVTAAVGSYSPGFSTDIGTLTDGPWSGSGNAGLVAVDKGIFTRLGLLSGTVATEGATVAGSGQQIAGRAADGTQHGACVTTLGVLCSPVAGTAQRVITKTSISASTNTTVCPTATTPVTTELLATSGSVGIGLNGQTLTTATIGTANTTPDMPLAAANTYYLLPVAATNAITAYSGTAQIIVCVQTIRS